MSALTKEVLENEVQRHNLANEPDIFGKLIENGEHTKHIDALVSQNTSIIKSNPGTLFSDAQAKASMNKNNSCNHGNGL